MTSTAPAIYYDPFDVEIDRVGAALARMEARIALAGTLARFPRWEVDPAQLVPVQTSTVRGFRSVPIRLD